MAFQLKFFDEVHSDVHEAKPWYKEQTEGLEEEFATAIEKAIEIILEIPNQCRFLKHTHSGL